MCTAAMYLPRAWHCRIFVRPSLTIEPEDDGCVVKRGGCICGPSKTEKRKKLLKWNKEQGKGKSNKKNWEEKKNCFILRINKCRYIPMYIHIILMIEL